MSGEWPETRAATSHQTVPGEHIARIAAVYGLRSLAVIWDHPANAALRALRETPHILAPGDRVFIPAVTAHTENGSTEQRHRFRAAVPSLAVRIARQQWDGTVIETPPDSVTRDGKPAEFTISHGTIDVPIEPFDAKVVATTSGTEMVAMIGFLQPVTTVPGFRERLNNLGYRAGDADDPHELAIRSAVEEFQCDQKLTVDGVCGPTTQKMLVQVHGC
jgi:hypothetical protein